MDRSRKASDRVRPFLEAMERSIDSVRRQRMEENGEITPAASNPPEPAIARPVASTPAPAPINHPAPPSHQHQPAVVNGDTPPAAPARLKARPKRPSSFNNDRYNNNDNLSQAG